MRQLIKQMLESDPEIKVVAVATDGIDALNKIEFYRPQVVTLDLEMPRMDGLTMLAELMRKHPLPVVVVSSVAVEGGEQTQALSWGSRFCDQTGGQTFARIMADQDELVLGAKRPPVRPSLLSNRRPAAGSGKVLPKCHPMIVATALLQDCALRYLLSKFGPIFPGYSHCSAYSG